MQYDEYLIVFQAYIALLCVAALVSKDTQRDKSALSVLAIWAIWILLTDQFNLNLPDFLLSIEAFAFSFFVLWALIRPYFYASADLSQRGENVYIGFYQGTHAPLLSSLAALFGLPFSSIVIVAGDKVLRSSGAGKMVINNTSLLRKGDFILVDTNKPATKDIIDAIIKCDGLPTRAFGVFKTKCVRNCEPILELLGLKPKSWPYYLPSIFYYQAVRGSHV
ncbi:MAG: hypothetical protein KAS66_05345 [Candidatus Omnitrophica bacterium]|nr:hypothetical protein [Candidatus Omnitrophota bacterium]